MKTIINRSRRPVKIVLPRGKTLHLGPSGRGQIHDDALERPALKKLIEAGEIEVLGEGGHESGHSAAADTTSAQNYRSTRGHPTTKNMSRKGDR